MPRLLSRFLVLIAAVQILGGHWAVLQTVAWTGMLIENFRHKPVAEALASTFDGSRPCSLCKVVTEGRQSEEQQDLTKVLVKLDAILAPSIELPPRAEMALHYFLPSWPDREVSFAPIKPPPRLA